VAFPHFFWDTYALVERLNGNEAYQPYAEKAIFTHQMNLYELAAALLRDHPETRVREALVLLAPNLLEAETEDLFRAARFRAEHAKKRISYVDALGYVLAQKHGMRFLTGDKQFKGIEGVEHVA
jgi:predicted nucleic acid-binding protein